MAKYRVNFIYLHIYRNACTENAAKVAWKQSVCFTTGIILTMASNNSEFSENAHTIWYNHEK